MTTESIDQEMMRAALDLARRGLYSTDPNPRVGCILMASGEIIGRGWHRRAGEPHAEVLALQQAGNQAANSTCYVTLEPCSHTGRTSPCADALIEAGIKRVVIATRDPDPRVAGAGAARLRAAGLEVSEGVLETEARELNAGFFSRHERGRPWVRLKMAQSLDGRTALENGLSQWITGPAARADGHHWRARAGAVMTGIGTVLADDPGLDARPDSKFWPGESGVDDLAAIQPLRCILDRRWRTPPEAATLRRPGRVLIFGSEHETPPDDLSHSSAELVPVAEHDGRLSLGSVMDRLRQESINELHVEAGAILSGSLLADGWVDELLIYLAPSILGHTGRPGFTVPPLESLAQRYHFTTIGVESIGPDLRWRLRAARAAEPV